MAALGFIGLCTLVGVKNSHEPAYERVRLNCVRLYGYTNQANLCEVRAVRINP